MKRFGIRDDAIVDSSSGGDGNEDKRRRRCRIINSLRRTLILSSFATLSLIFLAMTTRSREVTSVIEVPSCTNAPWKSDEDLRGKCPESFKSIPSAKSITQCATSCCEDLNCITWQYRADVGCLQGGDVRLGMEKDGVPAWCSDHAPRRWHGQRLVPKRGKKDEKKEDRDDDTRKYACDEATYNPNEEAGQCFGLGDVRPDGSGSAVECMRACCSDEKCGAWQWSEDLGCFYSKNMHSCQGVGDPVAFEPFVGRRKRLASRSYTGPGGKVWQMKLI